MAPNIEVNKVAIVYETIDAAGALRGSAKGKTVLVTGAGRGMFSNNGFRAGEKTNPAYYIKF